MEREWRLWALVVLVVVGGVLLGGAMSAKQFMCFWVGGLFGVFAMALVVNSSDRSEV